MAWIVLVLSGMLEAVWAAALSAAVGRQGRSRIGPCLLFAAALAASMGGLSWAMTSLPVGTAYAVWVGVGAVGTAILGIVLFSEPANAGRLISLGLIVLGIVGLKLTSAH